MKKLIFNISILASILIATTSCDDRLNKEPFDSVSEETLFSKPEGFTNAIAGVYKQFIFDESLNGAVYYGSTMFAAPDILTDNVILNVTGRQSRKIMFDWLYAPNRTGQILYVNAYKVIHNANVILKNTGNLKDADFRNNIEGEALTARALAHFDLVRMYGKIPTQSADANSSLGVAYVKTVDDAQQPARNTVKEVYDNIVTDLLEAKGKINQTNPAGRFNLNAVNALLSRVYLYMGEWQNCVDSANEVVGNVASRANFPSLWKDESFEGIIAQFLVRQIDRTAIGTVYSQTNPSTGVRSEYNASFDLYQLYSDDDIRKSSYVSTSLFNGNSYNHVAKYFGKTGQVNGKVNAKVIRMAEVMLNKAEALAELTKDGEALAALDAVRSQRYKDFVSGNETGQSLKDAIALEKRLEFAFESHRFFDLKRKGLPIVRSETFGDLSDGTGTPAVFTTLPANDFRFQYAIPEEAVQANSNLKQNPGY